VSAADPVAFAYVIRILKIRASRLVAVARDLEQGGAVDPLSRHGAGRLERQQAAEIRSAIAVLEAAPYATERGARGGS
jgi:hypothetical protein